MNQNANLRFLLALGGQKVVVLQSEHDTHIYADSPAPQSNVSVKRLLAALSER